MSEAPEPAQTVPLPLEERKMEIHKPKPIHNWREFLNEVGIIVLSICIALAAEQAVEWAHWRHEVSIARQALRAEIAANIANFLSLRVAVAPCVEREIPRPPGKKDGEN